MLSFIDPKVGLVKRVSNKVNVPNRVHFNNNLFNQNMLENVKYKT